MLNRKNIAFMFSLGLTIIHFSCDYKTPYEKMTDSKDGAMIYIAKANNGVQNLDVTAGAAEKTLKFGVGFGAMGLPSNEIIVTLINDTHTIDSLNRIQADLGLELYKKFPDNAFKIDQLKLTIPKGGLSSNLSTVTYFPDKFEKTSNYLMALTISDASSYPVNPRTKTLLLAVPKR